MHLEDYDAYFGFISRQFIEKSLQQPGDFLVRYGFSNRGKPQFIISVNVNTPGVANRGVTNVALAFDTMGFWYVCDDRSSTKDGFPSVIDLIDYYETHALPGVQSTHSEVYLKKSIPRPRWMLYSNLIDMKEAKRLGSGNFCVVDKANYIGFPVAVKTCHVSLDLGLTDDAIRASGDDASSPAPAETAAKKSPARRTAQIELTDTGIPEAQFQLLEEADVMCQLEHKHIIQFIGLSCEKPPLQLVMEFCEGGSLQTHLERMKADGVRITDEEMVMYLHQIALGMEYLESKLMVHRDLACRNVLLDKHGVLKVSDFGMAKLAAAIYGEDFSRSQIPLHGMAPECLQPKPAFTPKSDTWAYGMLTYEQYNHGAHVDAWKDWPLKKIATYIRRVKMPEPPKAMPDLLRDMVMLKCWLKEPQDRAGFGELAAILQDLIATKYSAPDPKETTLYKYAKLLPPTTDDAGTLLKRRNICDGIEEAMKARKKLRLGLLDRKKGPKKLKISPIVVESPEKKMPTKKKRSDKSGSHEKSRSRSKSPKKSGAKRSRSRSTDEKRSSSKNSDDKRPQKKKSTSKSPPKHESARRKKTPDDSKRKKRNAKSSAKKAKAREKEDGKTSSSSPASPSPHK